MSYPQLFKIRSHSRSRREWKETSHKANEFEIIHNFLYSVLMPHIFTSQSQIYCSQRRPRWFARKRIERRFIFRSIFLRFIFAWTIFRTEYVRTGVAVNAVRKQVTVFRERELRRLRLQTRKVNQNLYCQARAQADSELRAGFPLFFRRWCVFGCAIFKRN